MSAGHFENVAIIGAGGRIGSVMAEDLLKQGKHKVTAITRPESTSKLPDGLHDVKKLEYNDHASLVKAFKGQDIVLIPMNVLAPNDSQEKLIDAAVEAGVRYIMPNEWGGDYSDEELGRETGLGPGAIAIHNLSGSEIRYGFDFKERKPTLFDDGKQKHSCSTWPQVGRAVAKLLSLPVSGPSPCLDDWKNGCVHINSFDLSQQDMFESVLRVTHTKESDWTISHENTKERYQRGQEMFKQGDWHGFGMFPYTRVFYPDGKGLWTDLDNEKLGLPKEDLDKATKVAVHYAESGEAAAWS
ncbi:hypothetical protein LTR12_018217 [Friedmanniomyces endolithicus]|nr:hypothetical protein LTR12_018217 [Friedmanniomyces endolithicus]